MSKPSFTSTADFSAHLQRSERLRTLLTAVALGGSLILTLIRRAMGGLVMSCDEIFFPTLAVLAGGAGYHAVTWVQLNRWARDGRVAGRWRWLLGAGVELLVPAGMLLFLHLYSPRGPIAALSAPAMLLLPLVILLSVLRLDAMYSLGIGVAAALIHWGLTVSVVLRTHVDHHHVPVLASYGVYLIVIGIAAAVLAHRCRQYVRDGVAEATAGERAKAALEAVQRDLSVAREIQMGLMPRSAPTLDGFDIAGMARPAEQTGGDFYDWQPLPDGRLAVAMADVTGHGIGPALVMAVCRAYSRATAPTIPDPGALLERLNLLLQDDMPAGKFITMALALLDKAGSVQLGSAGHGPTMLYRAISQDVEIFGGDGIPLGLVPSEQYAPHQTFHMKPGDILLLLTDGFMEWSRQSDGQQYGIERLRQSLRAHAGKPAAQIIAGMDQDVRIFAGDSPQPDDMTIVAIRRLP